VSIVIVRCYWSKSGSLRWQVRFDIGLSPDITVAIRIAEGNQRARDYYLLPRIDMNRPQIRLAEYNGLLFDAYRFDTLDYLFTMAARIKLLEVA
jgi:hypothetical protein